MRVEIFNPQLSDFTAEQLSTIAESLMDSRRTLAEKRVSYIRVEGLAKMFAQEIVDLERRLEAIDEIIVQFAGALQIKEKENQIQSN